MTQVKKNVQHIFNRKIFYALQYYGEGKCIQLLAGIFLLLMSDISFLKCAHHGLNSVNLFPLLFDHRIKKRKFILKTIKKQILGLHDQLCVGVVYKKERIVIVCNKFTFMASDASFEMERVDHMKTQMIQIDGSVQTGEKINFGTSQYGYVTDTACNMIIIMIGYSDMRSKILGYYNLYLLSLM